MRVRGMAVAAAVGLGTLVAPAAQAAEVLDYVALGDSFAAGPLIPWQDPNLACARSTNNYPAVAAEALGAKLTDVSCSGAKVSDFAGRQFGYVAPQYNSLNAETDLVSLTIGGNDIGLVQEALGCLNVFPEPFGLSCKDRLTAGGDKLKAAIDAWAPTFAGALAEIKRRAPHAKVLVVGYATYIKPGGCYPTQPIWARDADYIQSAVNYLSATMRAQAIAAGATFVDTAAVSVGHDTCAAPSARYIEGLIPTAPAAPLHPNAQGMAAFGAAVATAAR
ncbi:SGNH/GDSL hydrolase family protein [Actinokineospora sp. HUAS TT18]|uniref:SGNH/GDSL hydrolase family protein n=1 Tax=Actinokineospora sp. HUAS TT18 TaxID=3447451 RepID=UPI003F5206DE